MIDRVANLVAKQDAAAQIAGELARLKQQAADARGELQPALIEAEKPLASGHAADLVEANEQLVLALMRAQVDADAARGRLQQASRSAERDPLTQLPNRVLLLDRLRQAIVNARRQGARLALLFLDLDNFKQVNDTLGHAVGDRVLKLAAQRLVASVRQADTVSRHGGDEFLILVGAVSGASDAMLIADKILAALAAPSRVGQHVLRLAATIGIAIYPDHGDDADALIDRADAAMYRAKRRRLRSLVFRAEASDAGGTVESSPVASMGQPLDDFELALAEHERRQVELREANEQLVLAALSAQALQAAAEQAHRQQIDFLAVLAHELRNPLAPIRAAAASLGRVDSAQPMLSRMQAIIERQVTHMSRLLDDLLDVSRATTGKLRIERVVVDLAGIIDEAVEACRPAMDTRLQRFRMQIPSRRLELQGDPVRLTQTISNLLDNASKYTPPGGDIRLSVATVDDDVVVTISDNGIGITAEALPHVFEPFVRDARAIGYSATGLGIGLTVVRELVEAHGGDVVARSDGSGLGSQFIVTLPGVRVVDRA